MQIVFFKTQAAKTVETALYTMYILLWVLANHLYDKT